MKAFLSFLALLLAFFFCTDAMSENAVGLENETHLLESELELAKKPQIYFIFDLKKGKIFLKSRGLVLKEMKIEGAKFWGRPVDIKPRALLQKGSLFKPKRVTIDPNKNKEKETTTTTSTGSFEIEALELKDMPTSYRLIFQEGIFVSIRPKAAGFFSRLYSAGHYLNWYISRPLLTLWNSIKNKPFTAIYLTVNEQDARVIYWSLTENSESIIYYP